MRFQGETTNTLALSLSPRRRGRSGPRAPCSPSLSLSQPIPLSLSLSLSLFFHTAKEGSCPTSPHASAHWRCRNSSFASAGLRGRVRPAGTGPARPTLRFASSGKSPQEGPCRQALRVTPISRKTSARFHWSSHVVLTLAGLAEGSLGFFSPFFPFPPPSLGSFEELAIEEDLVQVGRGDHQEEPPSSSMLRPPTGGPPPEGGPGSGSGETKRRAGLLSQWRQAWRLKHRWEKQEGSPGGHSSRLTPCLPPRARGRLRAPKHRQHLSQNALTLTLSRPQGPPSFVGALEGCEMSDVFFPLFPLALSLSLARSLARSLALSLSLSLSVYIYI